MSTQPPPGWHPDPYGTPDTLRWWDGTAWTEHTHPSGAGTAHEQSPGQGGYEQGGYAQEASQQAPYPPQGYEQAAARQQQALYQQDPTQQQAWPQQPPKPLVSAAELRPPAILHALGVLLMVGGLVGGGFGFAIAYNAANPGLQGTFTTDFSQAVQGGETWIIYAKDPDPQIRCTASPSGGASAARPTIRKTSAALSQSWGTSRLHAVYELSAPSDTSLSVHCSGSSVSEERANLGYGIRPRGGIVTMAAFGGGPLLVGIGGGLTLMLLVAMRRRAHRRRLFAERTGGAQHGG